MIDLNKEESIYLLVVRTFGLDKTTLTYDVTPYKTLTSVNNAVLDAITNTAKNDRDNIDYMGYTPHDHIDDDCGHISFGRVEFKSGVEKKYTVLRRKIQEAK